MNYESFLFLISILPSRSRETLSFSRSFYHSYATYPQPNRETGAQEQTKKALLLFSYKWESGNKRKNLPLSLPHPHLQEGKFKKICKSLPVGVLQDFF